MIARSLQAGLLYFAGVFALGFALGAIRMMLLAPSFGELLAVLMELPVILAGCWILARRSIVQLQVSKQWQARLTMGASALVLLWIAEFLLATFAFAETPAMFFAGLISPAGLIGLAGQVLFGFMPLLQSLFFEGD